MMQATTGQMPEWSKGADLRSAVFARVGSNPTLFTMVGRRTLKVGQGGIA